MRRSDLFFFALALAFLHCFAELTTCYRAIASHRIASCGRIYFFRPRFLPFIPSSPWSLSECSFCLANGSCAWVCVWVWICYMRFVLVLSRLLFSLSSNCSLRIFTCRMITSIIAAVAISWKCITNNKYTTGDEIQSFFRSLLDRPDRSFRSLRMTSTGSTTFALGNSESISNMYSKIPRRFGRGNPGAPCVGSGLTVADGYDRRQDLSTIGKGNGRGRP